MDEKDISKIHPQLEAAIQLLASSRRDLEYELLLMRLDDHEQRIAALEKKGEE
jgi:hypothetical protein